MRWVGLAAVCLLLAVPAVAQGPKPAPGVVQGLTQGNSNQPIQIEAATLEVRDKEKVATFSGNVQVVQGDTTLKCRTLVVFYENEGGARATRPARSAPAAKPAPGMPQDAQSIRRIEARGGVTVVTKDQNASGELGIFDMKTNTITLTGNVLVSQGQNVMQGDRVVVDMTTGVSRLESGKAGQNRVRALIQPGKSDNPAAAPKLGLPGANKTN